MSEPATLAECLPLDVRLMPLVRNFMADVWARACDAYAIRPGFTRVRVYTGVSVPHGVYLVTRHFRADGVTLANLLETGLKKKPRAFPRVPLACFEVLPTYAGLYSQDYSQDTNGKPFGWAAAGRLLMLDDFGPKVGTAAAWLMLADRIEDRDGSDPLTGYAPIDAVTSDGVAVAGVIRQVVSAGVHLPLPMQTGRQNRANYCPDDAA
jgi:hypothetical protein